MSVGLPRELDFVIYQLCWPSAFSFTMFCHPKMYFLSPHFSTSEVGMHLSIDGKQSIVMLFNWQWFFLVIHKITVCFRMMSYI